jgi:transposase
MHIKHCKLSKNKQLELMKYFIAGATVRTAADLVGIHRNTAIRFFHKLLHDTHSQQDRNEQFSGIVEPDESYFGGVRKDKRGRGGSAGEVTVFGILKRGSKVFSDSARDTKTDGLMPTTT